MSDKEHKPTPQEVLLDAKKRETRKSSLLLDLYLKNEIPALAKEKDMGEIMGTYREDFDKALGENWRMMATAPLLKMASIYSLFKQGDELYDGPKAEEFCERLIYMGHEIGDDDQLLEAFARDISHSVVVSGHKLNKFTDFQSYVRIGLSTGARFSAELERTKPLFVEQNSTIEVYSEEQPEPRPGQQSVFRDFINSLDIDDL